MEENESIPLGDSSALTVALEIVSDALRMDSGVSSPVVSIVDQIPHDAASRNSSPSSLLSTDLEFSEGSTESASEMSKKRLDQKKIGGGNVENVSNMRLEIRHLSNNFEKLLAQATDEIRKLAADKAKLEIENTKMLRMNTEMAEETAVLLKDTSEWRDEREGMMAANEEFATEVERLYMEEEKWDEEKEKIQLEKEIEEKERKSLQEQNEKLVFENEERKLIQEQNEKFILENNEERKLLQEQNELLLFEKNKTSSENDEGSELKEQNEKLILENKKLFSDNEQLRKEKVSSEKEKEKLIQENNKLCSDNEQLTKDKSSSEKEKEKLIQENNKLCSDNEQLSKDILHSEKGVEEMSLLLAKQNKLVESLSIATKKEAIVKEEFKQLSDENKQLLEQVQESQLFRMKAESCAEKLMFADVKIEKLTAENFEYAIELDKLSIELENAKVSQGTLKKDLEKLKKTDNPKLKETDVNIIVPYEELVGQMEILQEKNKAEMEKVKNLETWKTQLVDKNKEITAQNKKLLTQVESLEGLMSDEVTDINEILGMINNIQKTAGKVNKDHTDQTSQSPRVSPRLL